MKPSLAQHILPMTLAIAAGLSVPGVASAQVDAAAAQQVFEDNECGKCHSPDKAKKGPSLKKIAAKYKGKADAEPKVLEHMNKVQKVKQDDGKEVEHKIIDTKDPKVIKNVAQWILQR